MISHVLLQNVSNVETRTVLTALMMADSPPQLLRCALSEVPLHEALLKSGTALPIGTVEFVREAFRVSGILEPANMSYPPELVSYLGRKVLGVTVGEVNETWFVKPQITKQFTGFVYNPATSKSDLSSHDLEQCQAFESLLSTDLVWISEPVQWQSEWRYYVDNRQVLGAGRYDDGEDEAPLPNKAIVASAAAELHHAGPCALDFGVLTTGDTVLVEANDFWALGLYERALSGKQYLELLSKRWVELSGGR
jgi:hypothetical protein